MTRCDSKRATNLFVVLAMLVTMAIGVTAPAFGQVSGATLSGTVTDSSGAAVPNAEITITDMGKQTSRIVTTDFGWLLYGAQPHTGNLPSEGHGFRLFDQSAVGN